MAIETGTFSSVALYGPTTNQEETQGLRLATLSAVVIYGPASVGTDRPDLLDLVRHLPISSITETGTTVQGDIPTNRPDSEFVTGENTTVEQLTVAWASGPTTQNLIDFNATVLGSPIYAMTHS